MKRLNIQIDDETHRMLKSKASLKDLTIQKAIMHLIKQWVYQTTEAQ